MATVYILQSEYLPGRHRPVWINRGGLVNDTSIAPNYKVDAPEITLENVALLEDIARNLNKINTSGEPEYYAYDDNGTWMFERTLNWLDAEASEYAPS